MTQSVSIRTGLIVLGLAVFAALVYLPVLDNGFVDWDDNLYVFENPQLGEFGSAFLKRVFFGPMVANYHPLTMLSYGMDYAFWGLNPFGYHLTNVVLHALNTGLVFLLLVRLFPPGGGVGWGRSPEAWTAVLASLLFAVHPIHVESVAWISERKDVLYSAFYLLAILAYLRSVRSPSRRLGFYLVSAACHLLSLLSKPMAVTLPMVLLLLDVFPLGRLKLDRGEFGPDFRKAFLEKWPFFALSILFSILTLRFQGDLSETVPLWLRPFSAMYASLFYLSKLIVPVDLAPLYPYPHPLFSRHELPFWIWAGSALLFIGISAGCLRGRRDRPEWAVAWGLYLVQLLPVLGLVQAGEQVAADRYAYLPSLPMFFVVSRIVVGQAARVSAPGRTGFALAASAGLVMLTGLTWTQAFIWKDSLSLWNHQIRLYPDVVALPYNNRGIAHQRRGDFEAARRDFDKAIELDPDYALAHLNRGGLFMNFGQPARALQDFERALAINPGFDLAYLNRGILRLQTGAYWEALGDLTRAIELKPGSALAHLNRGRAFAALRAYPEALRDLSEAIALDPSIADAWRERGQVRLVLGDRQGAESDLRRAESMGGVGIRP